MESFLGQIGTALGILFCVAVATEIIIEVVRGGIAQISGTFFQKPFFASHRDLKEAITSVQDLFPEDNKDALLMLARLEDAHQKAKIIHSEKASQIEELIKKIGENESAVDIKKKVHAKLSEIASSVSVSEKQRSVYIKGLAGLAGIALCYVANVDAFAVLEFVVDDHEETKVVATPWGMVATGLAAAGGSTFWHDQIERVRLLKSATAMLNPSAPQKPA